jgi:hypothetical protein
MNCNTNLPQTNICNQKMSSESLLKPLQRINWENVRILVFTTISIREKHLMFVSSVLSFVVFGSSCFIYVILNYYTILSTRFEGAAYSSRASEFIPDILWGSCWSVFSVLWDVEYCLSCCPFSSGHCFVCPSYMLRLCYSFGNCSNHYI